MSLTTLSLHNFRSYKQEKFKFHPKTTIIQGQNGSGKTNILEAIYMLSMTRSWRGLPQQVAYRGSDWFRVYAQLGKREEVALAWKQGQKQASFNKKELKPHEFIGRMPTVLFEPGNSEFIYGPPAGRRQLMDRVLSFTDRNYLVALLKLRRILRQRNNLLRQPRLSKDQIFGWDVLMVEQADYIRKQREKLVIELNKLAPTAYKKIANNQTKINLQYYSQVKKTNYADNLLKALEQTLEKDHRYGSTGVGPHRDDIKVSYQDRLLSEVGSRGEVRTAVLAIALAELEYLRKHAERPPILLLDDVFSELDEQRQTALIDNIKDIQTIITTTKTPKNIQGAYATIKLPL